MAITTPSRPVAAALAPWILPATVACIFALGLGGDRALLSGIVVAFVCGNPWLEQTRRWTTRLLGWCIMALGAGMDLAVVLRVGAQGLGYTALGIAFTIALGLLLARRLRVEGDTGLLVAAGTAICGGSAIAAVAATIRAKPQETSVALATVFMLNAVALWIFPVIGHWFHLSEEAFGLWSALAIHDTSSVVGATMAYGARALEVGTTVKLARALWIVPVALVIGRLRPAAAVAGGASRAKKPWFILGFIGMAALVTAAPALREPGQILAGWGRRGMVLALFLIGTSLNREALSTVGLRPVLQGLILWLVVAAGTLGLIMASVVA